MRAVRHEAQARLKEAAELLNGNDWPEVAGGLAMQGGIRAQQSGQFADAVPLFEQARSAFVACGELTSARQAAGSIGVTLAMQGRLDEAPTALERALAFSDRHRLRPGTAATAAQLAGIRLGVAAQSRGELARALFHLGETSACREELDRWVADF